MIPLRLLVVAAHCDDLEIGCAGLVRRVTREGGTVTSVVMAGGQSVDHRGTVWRQDDAGYEATRRAAELLGFDHVVHLSYPDMEVPYSRDSIQKLNGVIDAVTPDLIVTHWPDDVNQDHQNTARAAITAARHHKNVWCMEPPAGKINFGIFGGVTYVTMNEEDLKLKIRAILAHETEYHRLGGESHFHQHETRCRAHGVAAGAYAAELFHPLRMVL